MRTHANRGRFFEEYLQHLHTRYRLPAQAGEQGRARIDFIPTPTRPHNGQDGVTWKPVHKGIVDFVGVLAGGRFVAFDAKSTRDVHGWSVKVSRRSPNNDTTHQWEYLADVHALGGLAFYLVYAETLDQVFVALMPFPPGKKMRFTEMIEVARDENGWWDWLRTLEQVGALWPAEHQRSKFDQEPARDGCSDGAHGPAAAALGAHQSLNGLEPPAGQEEQPVAALPALPLVARVEAAAFAVNDGGVVVGHRRQILTQNGLLATSGTTHICCTRNRRTKCPVNLA